MVQATFRWCHLLQGLIFPHLFFYIYIIKNNPEIIYILYWCWFMYKTGWCFGGWVLCVICVCNVCVCVYDHSRGALAVCHGVRSIGQVSSLVELWNQVSIQCRWKTWLHSPHTSGQSSPGLLQLGQQPSYAEWHMPHTSSPSFTSQAHSATIVQDSTLIFILKKIA